MLESSNQYCENIDIETAKPSLISQWTTKDGADAYTMYLNLNQAIQTPWLILRDYNKTHISLDVIGPPLVNAMADDRNQEHTGIFRSFLDDIKMRVAGLFKERMLSETGMLLGDDCKVGGIYKHNYDTYTDVMRIKSGRMKVYERDPALRKEGNEQGWHVITLDDKNRGARCMLQIQSVHYINDAIYITVATNQLELLPASRSFDIEEPELINENKKNKIENSKTKK